MNEVVFVKQREPDWKRLNLLCDKADVTPKALDQRELREFIQLYRRASSDLALARTQSGNLQLVTFLNDLVGRAYVILYRPTRGPFVRAVKFGIEYYAAVARRQKVFIWAAAITFFLGAVFSGMVMQLRPDLRHHFVSGESDERNMEAWKKGLPPRTGEESMAMTGFYASNNPKVSIITAAVSASTFGVLTATLLWKNGEGVGALGSELKDVGKLHLLTWLLPHGMSEIQGILISGGSGYLVGWTLIFPGQRRRGDALRDAAKDGLILLCGAAVLMFIAAPFEGFFSFNPNIPIPVKLLVAGAVGTAWWLFYTRVGRQWDAVPELPANTN